MKSSSELLTETCRDVYQVSVPVTNWNDEKPEVPARGHLISASQDVLDQRLLFPDTCFILIQGIYLVLLKVILLKWGVINTFR